MQNGDVLGPYQVTGRLGEGGMGAVYRARDIRLFFRSGDGQHVMAAPVVVANGTLDVGRATSVLELGSGDYPERVSGVVWRSRRTTPDLRSRSTPIRRSAIAGASS